MEVAACGHSVLLLTPPTPLPLPGSSGPLVTLREPGRRDRVWELGATLHCSIVGTCLTTADLRALFAKLGDADARSASEHALHGRAVATAGQPGIGAKLLNKLLDRRHATHVKRFAAAHGPAAVRTLWAECLARGDIPGGYWATLTHPDTDRALVQLAFGEVHMLSHLIGTANRTDIVRLRALEQALAERDETIARQQTRLRQAAEAPAQPRREPAALRPVPAPLAAPPRDALTERLAAEQARADDLAARADALAVELKASAERITALNAMNAALGAEIAALEAEAARPAAATPAQLGGRTILYVGGRPKLTEQLKAFAVRQGGALIAHDGGVEESASLLPGLVSRADVAVFPVDCVSHHAAEQVKRLCRQLEKPFVALRSASLASFAAAVADLG